MDKAVESETGDEIGDALSDMSQPTRWDASSDREPPMTIGAS